MLCFFSVQGGNGAQDIPDAEKLHSLPQNELLNCFHSLGDQLHYLWKIFLKIHRENKAEILEFLRNTWAKDRKSEWSIWMMYSKVEMPHHYINSGGDESSRRGMHKRVSSLWKLPDEVSACMFLHTVVSYKLLLKNINFVYEIIQPLETAISSAELHRRSIAQMRVSYQLAYGDHPVTLKLRSIDTNRDPEHDTDVSTPYNLKK